MFNAMRYRLWWAHRCIGYAARSSAQRANNAAMPVGAVGGVLLHFLGIKMTASEPWGTIIAGFTGIGVAWVLVFFIRLGRVDIQGIPPESVL